MRHRAYMMVILFTSLISVAYGQPSIRVNLQNMHLWRGGEVADGFVITSDVAFDFLQRSDSESLKLGFWGGTNAKGEYKEFNYYASYSVGGFSFVLADTYNFSTYATYNNQEFFNYRPSETGRFIDARFKYRFGENFPLLIGWSTVIFGRDRDLTNSRNIYSTYCSVEYPIYTNENWTIDLGAGGAFALAQSGNKPNFYGDKAGIVQVTLRVSNTLRLGNFKLPVFIMPMWNPQANKGYLQFGAMFEI